MDSNKPADAIYLDYNATTPLHPSVCKVLNQAIGEGKFTGLFGNPSSDHCYGQNSKNAIEQARQNVSKLLDAECKDTFFVSCGTEANNMSINGAIKLWRNKYPDIKPTIVTTCIEHPGTLECLKEFQKSDVINVHMLNVDEFGRVQEKDLLKVLEEVDNICLITLMHANNEIGSVNDISSLFKLVRNFREKKQQDKTRCIFPLTHVDCAQSVGKIPVSFKYLNCDMMSVVGHKFYAPKGIGVIVIDRDNLCDFPKLLFGGSQESGMRPGTENVLLDVAIGEASRLCLTSSKEWAINCARLVERLYNNIKEGIETRYEEAAERIMKVNGVASRLLAEGTFSSYVEKYYKLGEYEKQVGALPNTLSVSFYGLDARVVTHNIGDKVCISTGSACHSSCDGPSEVLTALGIEEYMAQGTLRISLGAFTTEQEIDGASRILVAHIVRNLSGSNFI